VNRYLFITTFGHKVYDVQADSRATAWAAYNRQTQDPFVFVEIVDNRCVLTERGLYWLTFGTHDVPKENHT
jgi:hypothetical protein